MWADFLLTFNRLSHKSDRGTDPAAGHAYTGSFGDQAILQFGSTGEVEFKLQMKSKDVALVKWF